MTLEERVRAGVAMALALRVKTVWVVPRGVPPFGADQPATPACATEVSPERHVALRLARALGTSLSGPYYSEAWYMVHAGSVEVIVSRQLPNPHWEAIVVREDVGAEPYHQDPPR